MAYDPETDIDQGGDIEGHVAALDREDQYAQQQQGIQTAEPPPAPARPSRPIRGLVSPGNIDLNNRPVVHNEDGSISTVRSITVGGGENEPAFVLPTVIGGRVVSNEDAINYFKQTGQHLGQFDNLTNATTYAHRLHREQAQQYLPREPQQPAPTRFHPSQATPTSENITPLYSLHFEAPQAPPGSGKLTLADYGDQVWRATMGMGAALTGAASAVAHQIDQDPKLRTWTDNWRDWMTNQSEATLKGMTPRAQEVLSASVLGYIPGSLSRDAQGNQIPTPGSVGWSAYLALNLTSMIPDGISMLLPASIAGRAAVWAAEALGAGKRMIQTAGAIGHAGGMGSYFGTEAAGSFYNNSVKLIEGASDTELKQGSPVYAQMRQTKDVNESKAELVRQLGPLTLGAFAAGFLGGAGMGMFGRGVMRGALGGAVSMGAQGGATQALEQGEQKAIGLRQDYDLKSIMADTISQGVGGLVMGGIAGRFGHPAPKPGIDPDVGAAAAEQLAITGPEPQKLLTYEGPSQQQQALPAPTGTSINVPATGPGQIGTPSPLSFRDPTIQINTSPTTTQGQPPPGVPPEPPGAPPNVPPAPTGGGGGGAPVVPQGRAPAPTRQTPPATQQTAPAATQGAAAPTRPLTRGEVPMAEWPSQRIAGGNVDQMRDELQSRFGYKPAVVSKMTDNAITTAYDQRVWAEEARRPTTVVTATGEAKAPGAAAPPVSGTSLPSAPEEAGPTTRIATKAEEEQTRSQAPLKPEPTGQEPAGVRTEGGPASGVASQPQETTAEKVVKPVTKSGWEAERKKQEALVNTTWGGTSHQELGKALVARGVAPAIVEDMPRSARIEQLNAMEERAGPAPTAPEARATKRARAKEQLAQPGPPVRGDVVEAQMVHPERLEAPEGEEDARVAQAKEDRVGDLASAIQAIPAPRGSALEATLRKAQRHLSEAIGKTDGSREAVAELIHNWMEGEPTKAYPGSNITARMLGEHLMQRVTGMRPVEREGVREEIAEARREDVSREAGEPKVAPGEVETVAEKASEGAEGTSAVATSEAKPEKLPDTTDHRRTADNLIQKVMNGSMTPEEASDRYGKPQEGRGAKRRWPFLADRMRDWIKHAEDPANEEKLIADMKKSQETTGLTPVQKRNEFIRIRKQLERIGPEAAATMREHLRRMEDRVGYAADNEAAKAAEREHAIARTAELEGRKPPEVLESSAGVVNPEPHPDLVGRKRWVPGNNMSFAEAIKPLFGGPYKILADRISKLIGKIPVRFRDPEDLPRRYGQYNIATDRIDVRGTLSNGHTVQVLLHEGVHAATHFVIHTDEALYQRATELLGQLKIAATRKDTPAGIPGMLKNIDEMLAHGLTDEHAQAWLAGIKMPGEGDKLPTGWQKFKALIKDALGLKSDAERSALDELLDIGNRAFNHAERNAKIAERTGAWEHQDSPTNEPGWPERLPEYDRYRRELEGRRDLWTGANMHKAIIRHYMERLAEPGITDAGRAKLERILARVRAKYNAGTVIARRFGVDPEEDFPVDEWLRDMRPTHKGFLDTGTPSAEGLNPLSSRYLQMANEPRIDANYLRAVQAGEAPGAAQLMSHDLLRQLSQDPLISHELEPFRHLVTQLLRVSESLPVYTPERLIERGELTPEQFEDVTRQNIYGAYGQDEHAIMVNPNAKRVGGTHVETFLHEVLHSVTSRYLRELEKNDKFHPDLQAMNLILSELKNQSRIMLNKYPELRTDPTFLRFYRAGMNVHEAHTMLMSSPAVQAFAATLRARPEFRAKMVQLGYPPGAPTKSVWSYFSQWVRKAVGLRTPGSASEYTLLDHLLKPITDITDRAAQYNRKLLPKDPTLGSAAEPLFDAATGSLSRRTRDIADRMDLHGLGDRARKFFLQMATSDGIVAKYARLLPGLEQWRAAYEGIQRSSKDFADTYADKVKDLTGRFNRSDEAPELGKLMTDATLAKAHLGAGVTADANAHLTTPAERSALAALQGRYNRLSPEGKALYNEFKTIYAAWYKQRRSAELGALIRGFMPDVTDAQYQAFTRAAASQRGLASFLNNPGRSALAASFGDSWERNASLVKGVARVHNQGFVQGDYFPLRRYGNYVVRYGDRNTPEAYGVEMFTSRRKAELRRAELQAAGMEPFQVAEKNESAMRDLIPNHPAVGELTASLERHGYTSDEAKEVRDTLNSILLQHASHSAASRAAMSMRRRGVQGASIDHGRILSDEFMNNQVAMGHLDYGLARAKAIGKIRNEDVPTLEGPTYQGKSGDAITGGSVLHEIEQRSTAIDRDNVWQSMGAKANMVSYALNLMSPSHMVTASMEAHTNALAFLAARHGIFKANYALAKALAQASPMIYTGAKRTLAAVRAELLAKDWNMPETLKNRMIAKGSSRAGMTELFKALEDANLIDHTMLKDMQYQANPSSRAGGVAYDVWARFRDFSAASAHAVDVMNKVAIAKASFDLEFKKNGGNISDAVKRSVEMTRRAIPNYNIGNKPRIGTPHGSLGVFGSPLTQFKMYGMHMYTTMATLAQESMRGPERWEARRALAYTLATHAAMAGVLGLPLTDALRYIMGAYDLVTGEAKPHDYQADLRQGIANVFGPEIGELISRGLPHAIGIDVHRRVGLSNLLEIPEMASFDKAGAKDVLLGLATGASGESLVNLSTGFDRMLQGDIMGGFQKLLPRTIRNVMEAYDLSQEGVKTQAGRVMVPPERVSAGAVASLALGFQPTVATEAREGSGAIQQVRDEMQSEHTRLTQRWLQASTPERRQEIWYAIQRFNDDPQALGFRITMDQLRKDLAAQHKRAQQPGAFGLRLPAKAAHQLMQYGSFANVPQ